MRPLPFLLLYLAVLATLLSAVPLLSRWAPGAAAALAPPQAAEAVMAVPPKPTGLDTPEGGGEGSGQARLTLDACEKMAPAVKDACWQALARQQAGVDPAEALAVCGRVTDAELALECQADVAETIAPADRVFAEGICGSIASVKWRGQCHFGIGLALAEIDPAYAMGRCDHAEAFRLFCRHDVVGEVALVDVEAAIALCAREEGEDLARKTCWHGVAKYLARRSLDEAAASCERATPAWQGNCMHGAGWGAAERDPDATLAACPRWPQWRDNCQQGVAHQQKRIDAARAVALCEDIGTPAIRERCLAFVRR